MFGRKRKALKRAAAQQAPQKRQATAARDRRESASPPATDPARGPETSSSFKFTAASASDAGFDAAALQELPAYLDALVGNDEYPGFVAVMARGDKLVLGQTTGLHDRQTGASLRHDAIFHLKSMSKPFAAVAMMLLHEEGRWAIGDSVSKHLPEFKDIMKLPGSAAARADITRAVHPHGGLRLRPGRPRK